MDGSGNLDDQGRPGQDQGPLARGLRRPNRRGARQHFDRKTEGQDWCARQVHVESTRTTFEMALNAHIYPKIGACRIASIRQADVRELVAKWSATATPTTVHLRYGVLAIVMKAAAKERVLAGSPCRHAVVCGLEAGGGARVVCRKDDEAR
ncbi:hypothetical protein [Nocardioides sp. NPDC127503]|uniref:phage integrase central domain-containing protein n=1 Tax=Nocardioides sp. NPDC127503 TaxID=3154516 RepID=UPI00332F135C